MPDPAQVKSAFRYRTEIQAMMSDPDLTGEVLLLSVALFNRLQTETEKGRKRRTLWKDVQADLGWNLTHLKHIIGKDFPRYEIDYSAPVYCSAPMIRREGTCDKSTTWALTFEDRDPETGDGKRVGFCSRHGALQFDIKARIKQWRENGMPEPPHNTGGILRRYFDGNWAEVYQWANPWKKLTDGTGKPATPPRPALTLIRGGAA